MDDVVMQRLASSEFRAYPFLTPEEFIEVCHYLESRYSQARLGIQRRRWKLRSRRVLNPLSDFFYGPSHDLFLQITVPLETARDDEGLSSSLNAFSLAEPGEETEGGDIKMMEAEEADQANKADLPPGSDPTPCVKYEISLHRTYQVPCLWFHLQNLPIDEEPLGVDTVFRRLVPDQYKETLRASMGGIGGISIDENPFTGMPCFFIHPCLIGEQMKDFDCSKDNYLMVWLGLVGGCVGLWVPPAMVLAPTEEPQRNPQS